jgi:hypothetical protein
MNKQRKTLQNKNTLGDKYKKKDYGKTEQYDGRHLS